MLEQALGKTAITVQNPRDDEYETDGRAYLGLKRDARDIKLGMPPPNKAGGQPSKPSNSERLSELKAMRDKGLITEQEYQAKRRQILDEM
jgi:Short C-terminal domain